MQPTDIWHEALSRLETQMTKEMFHSNLKGATLNQNSPNDYALVFSNALIQARVQHRMDLLLQRVLSDIVGHPVTISYETVAKHAVPNQVTPDVTTDTTSTGNEMTWAAAVDWRNIQNKSYMPLSTYAIHFWQPWLNQRNARTFALWLAIRGDDKRLGAASKDFVDFWTPPRNFRIRKLAGEIGSKNSTTSLTGRFAPCNRCYKALLAEQPLEACCGYHSPTQWKQVGEDRRVCQYWSVGAFESLQEAGLLAVNTSTGPTKKHSLQLQVWMLLPVLTPAQVATLPHTLQSEHKVWLANYGHIFDLTAERWAGIDTPTLLPHLPYYQEKRQLGRYEWNKIKREQLE